MNWRCIKLTVLILISGPILLQAQQLKSWIRTWEAGESVTGQPAGIVSNTQKHRSKCGDVQISTIGTNTITDLISYNGLRSNMGGFDLTIGSNPCANEISKEFITHLFPDYDGRFSFPVLIRIWMYYQANEFTENRISQLTVKGRLAGEILTTRILSDGSININHGDMSFQDRNVKVPLNKWHMQSLYIENFNGRTIATAWIDTLKAVQATANQVWIEGELRRWHALFYSVVQPNNYPIEPVLLYNDDLMIDEVLSLAHANTLIWESFVETPTIPEDTSKVKVTWTWSPNPIPAPDTEFFNVYWGNVSRGYDWVQPTSDTTFVEFLQAGQQWFTAVTAIDTAKNESLFSDEFVFTTQAGADTTAPGRPINVKVE